MMLNLLALALLTIWGAATCATRSPLLGMGAHPAVARSWGLQQRLIAPLVASVLVSGYENLAAMNAMGGVRSSAAMVQGVLLLASLVMLGWGFIGIKKFYDYAGPVPVPELEQDWARLNFGLVLMSLSNIVPSTMAL